MPPRAPPRRRRGLSTHASACLPRNEPDYAAALYSDILLGMARGAKAADPRMRVLPGIVVGHDLLADGFMNASHLQHLDGLNTHVYAYHGGSRGRVAAHPESKVSLMRRELLQQVRFRDAHLPGLPLYVSEWGWDSAGGGEECGFSECVSERAQALYAVRGALLLARLGVERASWFFASNIKAEALMRGEVHRFSRSGLTASADRGFAPKQSLRAFEQLVALLGQRHFVRVLREDDEAWVYALGHANGTATHVAAWRPVDGDDSAQRRISLDVQTLGTVTPGETWEFSGLVPSASEAGRLRAMKPRVRNSSHWELTIRSAPLVVALTPPVGCDTSCEKGTCFQGQCVCFAGFSGADCATRLCENACWNHGLCDGTTGLCTCENWINERAGVNSSAVHADRSMADLAAHPSWILWDPASSCRLPRCMQSRRRLDRRGLRATQVPFHSGA